MINSMHLLPLNEPNYQGLGQRLDKTLQDFNKRKGTRLSNSQCAQPTKGKTSLTESSHLLAKARKKLREMRSDNAKHTRRLDLVLK